MPIKKKLRYWALAVPGVGFFILANAASGFLTSLGGFMVLAAGLYFLWAGAYWTLLQARAFIEKHNVANPDGAQGGRAEKTAAAARHMAAGAGRLLETLREAGPRASQALATPSSARPQVSVVNTDLESETDLEPVGHSHAFRAIADIDRHYSPGASARPRSLQGVPAAHADIIQAIEELRPIIRQVGKRYDRICTIYIEFVLGGELERAESALRMNILQRAPAPLYDRIMHAGGGSKFAGGMDLRRAGLVIPEAERQSDAIFVGETDSATVNPPAPIVHQGEGHLLTIASTGSGKGQRYILPTLMTYAGPVVCLDPKGENYRTAKGQRDLFGRVFKWAPFDRDGDTDSFNPIDAIEDWDDARVVADLLIAPADSGEKRFWDQSARDFVRGLIMYVRTLEPARRTMREVVRILYASEDEHDALRERLSESNDEMLVELANQFGVMADRMFASILQSARAELDVWRSEAIAKTTSTTSERWDVGLFVTKLRMQELQIALDMAPGPLGYSVRQYPDGTRQTNRGPSDSVFFVMPPDRIRSYASVLRVLLGVHLNAWSRAESILEEDTAKHQPFYQVPALFVFDELAQLGHMPIIEDQIAIARSAKIRMWLIAQDLPQLKRTYPRWESMLGNCRTQIFFGVNDLETATYVSNRAGEKTTVFEEARPLVTPTELMGPSFVDKAIIFARGVPPIQAYLPSPYYSDEDMREIERFLKGWGSTLPRRERQERPAAPKGIDEGESVDDTVVGCDLSGEPEDVRGSSEAESDASGSATPVDEEEATAAGASSSMGDRAGQQLAAEEAPSSAGDHTATLRHGAGDAEGGAVTGSGGARKTRPRKPASNSGSAPPQRKPRPRKRPEPPASKND